MIVQGMMQGATAFAAYVIVVLLLLRAVRKNEPTFIVLFSALLVFPLSITVWFLLQMQINFWVFSTAYWFLVLCFLMGFGAVYKSLSLRMLLELLEKPDHTHSAEEFRQEYIFGDSFHHRLQLIVDQGLAERHDGSLSLTVRGKKWAEAIIGVQRAFGITRSG